MSHDTAPRRVFVSGIGAITPYGLGVDALKDGLYAGRSAIGPITAFDASRFQTRFGGELPATPLAEHFDARDLPWLSSLTAHGVIAARLALADAGITNGAMGGAGVIFGSGFGTIAEAGPHFLKWAEVGDTASRPTTIPSLMLNAPAAQIAIYLGLTGPSLMVSTACSSGSHAIGQAYREIREGRREAMVAGGGEHALTELMLLSWSRLRVLSRRNDEPARACRPFDTDRDGLVLADAVVLLVLESEASLAARGGRALAEIAGYASNCDASHLTAPNQATEVLAIREALVDAGSEPGDVDLVVAHGTATRLNDRTEGHALREVFGDNGAFPVVTAPKSMLGHAMGASGALGVAAGVFALQSGKVTPTTNLDHLDPDCGIPMPPATAEAIDPEVAIVDAFAFGGHNAVVVLKK
ncbi:MAG TPA: beta-ketoacyl-[acyl-carrier-protein] synthase family protein [Candidatus Polarisedimenticolaceae bacterium]|nr:beta-ketoacyl-[acyl-carrier-protein] synthase family protein [Candidatus Polarisedimenticolaceae bacterium]